MISLPITKNEAKVAAMLFRSAADQFGNHGCNDLGKDVIVSLTEDEWRELGKKYAAYNGEPNEEYGAGGLFDFMLMGYFASVLNQASK